MIARFWSARASPAHAPLYARHLTTHVLPALKIIDGYEGAMLLQRADSSGVEILVITLWHSLEAIERFAGADHERAVVADEAAALLTRFDRRARHFELILRDG